MHGPTQVPQTDTTLIKDHYSRIDFSFWDEEVHRCFQSKIETSQESDIVNDIRIYATYLQLIEVFFMNIFAITQNNLTNLFLRNEELREVLGNVKTRDAAKSAFLDEWVFYVADKSTINNYEKKKTLYTRLLDESISDYLQDYELLNAYKHGFRTHARGPMTVSISADSNPGQVFLASSHNCSVNFLCKEKDFVYERTIGFNWQRIMQKCEFILHMLENTKIRLETTVRLVDLNTLFPLDEITFDQHFGVSRFKKPLYVLTKTMEKANESDGPDQNN